MLHFKLESASEFIQNHYFSYPTQPNLVAFYLLDATPISLQDEKKLVLACVDGDKAAFETLYRQFAPRMLVVCSRYGRDQDEAADLLQEGFIRVFEQLGTFRGDGSLEGWIRRVMVSIALAHYQRHHRQREQSVSLSSSLPEEQEPFTAEDITAHLSFEELLRLVQELPPAYRLVFNLYVFEGMKHHEIALQLGIAEGTSKSNLSQARRILQRKLKTLVPNPTRR